MSKIEHNRELLLAKISKDEYLNLMFDDKIAKEPYEIRVVPDLNTGAWAFRDKKHHIFIGLKMGADLLSDEMLQRSVETTFRHEVSHSLYTERDLEMISSILKRKKIPFGFFNLAEDVRIERVSNTNEGFVYNRKSFKVPPSVATPTEILFSLKFYDGELVDDAQSHRDSERVYSYYNRFCECQDSLDLIPIIEEWGEEFGFEDEDDNQGLGTNAPEDELMSNEEFEELMSQSQLIDSFISGSEEEASESDSDNEVELNSVSIDSMSYGELLSSYEKDWDLGHSKRLASQHNLKFKSQKRLSPSSRATRKFNKNAFKPGATTDKFYMEELVDSKAVRHVDIILDVSGSMRSTLDDMRIVIGFFNELSKKRVLKGRLILSGVSGSKSMYQTFEFPISDSVISRIDARCGAEGIETTMRENIKELQKADLIFVLTDGKIGDKPIDKSYYHKRGLYTAGVYIGESNNVNLNNWFDKGVALKSVDNCVNHLINLLLMK